MAVVVFTGAVQRFRRDLAPGSPVGTAHEQTAATESAAAGGQASTAGTA